MPIDAVELVQSLAALQPLDLEQGFAPALQQTVDAARILLDADAAGLMLADADGVLRWASASDQVGQIAEAGQERLSQGPCSTAFAQQAPAAVRDAANDPKCGDLASVLLGVGVMAALSVPVEVEGGPIGTLDVYTRSRRDWDASDVAALQAYAGVVGSLLASVSVARVQGRLATQLQAALEHRSAIERARGMLMAKYNLDAQTAFERLRGQARSSGRKVVDIATELLARHEHGVRPRG
jgi:GAF domain-containing protein